MRWCRPAFAIALDKASKPAGYDGMRRLCTASVARLPFRSPPSALGGDEQTGRLQHLSVGVHWHRLHPHDRVAVEVLGRPAVAEHGLPPGRGAERVQVNPFHGDQGMFGIALAHVWREVKGNLAVLPAAYITGSLGAPRGT
jgi:hypothetical protein